MTVKSTESKTALGQLDQDVFNQNFNKRPFTIKHKLANHELFDLERLIGLSQALPSGSVEYNSGEIPVSQDPTKTPMNGLSADETIRRIQECRSWLVLKNVEQDPAYRQLLDSCLDEVQAVTEKIAPGMTRREGFIFISSPGSVTPYHIDPENNFLLQIRGEKKVHMFDPMDREVLSEVAIENFFAGAHRNMKFEADLQSRGSWFDLTPGDGLHFPVVAPHWVQNGSQVSISFSITFQTDDSMRRQTLHRINRRLRKFGLTPSPVGFHPRRDNNKYAIANVLRQTTRLWKRG